MPLSTPLTHILYVSIAKSQFSDWIALFERDIGSPCLIGSFFCLFYRDFGPPYILVGWMVIWICSLLEVFLLTPPLKTKVYLLDLLSPTIVRHTCKCQGSTLTAPLVPVTPARREPRKRVSI